MAEFVMKDPEAGKMAMQYAFSLKTRRKLMEACREGVTVHRSCYNHPFVEQRGKL